MIEGLISVLDGSLYHQCDLSFVFPTMYTARQTIPIKQSTAEFIHFVKNNKDMNLTHFHSRPTLTRTPIKKIVI